jgi:nicotinamidase-related amidase
MVKKAQSESAAMVLIDHQTGTMDWIRSIDHGVVEANTRALAKVAVALGMPIVFTSSIEDQIQGPLMPDLGEIAPDEFSARIKRPGVVNCWDDPAFAQACRDTNRQQFIMSGVTTEVCLAPPAISAVEAGFEVFSCRRVWITQSAHRRDSLSQNGALRR